MTVVHHSVGGWNDAPRTNAQHAAGTLVAAPSIAHGCWACAERVRYKGAPVRARSCSLRARNGRLTCHAHRKLEPAAKALRDAAKEHA